MRDLLLGASLAMHVLGYFAWRGAQRRNERLSAALQERGPVPALPPAARPRLAEKTVRDTNPWWRPLHAPLEVVRTEEVELVEVAGAGESFSREAEGGVYSPPDSSPAPASMRVTKRRFADSSLARAWGRVDGWLADRESMPGNRETAVSYGGMG